MHRVRPLTAVNSHQGARCWVHTTLYARCVTHTDAHTCLHRGRDQHCVDIIPCRTNELVTLVTRVITELASPGHRHSHSYPCWRMCVRVCVCVTQILQSILRPQGNGKKDGAGTSANTHTSTSTQVHTRSLSSLPIQGLHASVCVCVYLYTEDHASDLAAPSLAHRSTSSANGSKGSTVSDTNGHTNGHTQYSWESLLPQPADVQEAVLDATQSIKRCVLCITAESTSLLRCMLGALSLNLSLSSCV